MTEETIQRRRTMLSLPDSVRDTFARITPEERDAYVAVLRAKGWTLASIAEVSDVSRERVRQIARDVDAQDAAVIARDYPQPLPPVKYVKPRAVYVEPDADKIASLREKRERLTEMTEAKAKGVAVSGYRALSAEVTEGIRELVEEDGVPQYRVALRLGVTHAAVRQRLLTLRNKR